MENLRPQYLAEFIGKENLKENLKIFIASCKTKHTILDHVLLWGHAGTGKTTLATIIANEMESKIHYIQGPCLKKPLDIMNALSLIKESDIVFIDEIHAIDKSCLEVLYSIMEQFVIDVPIGKDFNTSMTRIKVPNFTLIGATTQLGKLPEPLQERFGIQLHLDGYQQNELEQIVSQHAHHAGFVIDDQDQYVIASYSKGIPRNAIRLTNRFLDYKSINQDLDAIDIMQKMGIYDLGLTETDIKYLSILFENVQTSIGIKSLSQSLSIDSFTIENKLEPYLLINNLILKTPSGRTLTKKGVEYMHKLNQLSYAHPN